MNRSTSLALSVSVIAMSPRIAFAQTAAGQAGQTTTASSIDYIHLGLLLLLAVFFVAAFVYYQWRLRKFESSYADLLRKLPRMATAEEGAILATSPGHSFALASRGPTYAFDAELKSAEARWRHLMAAFPQLDVEAGRDHQKYILVPSHYTSLAAVHDMQHFIENQITDTFGDRIYIPERIRGLNQDFDVLKYPEFAIANPCFYTLPFFLTWQRRNLWGVLPYATHSRLGLFIREDHPQIDDLKQVQSEHEAALEREAQYGLWVQDPSHARWLPIILDAAGDKPSRLDRTKGELHEQHKTPTVFSVGAYLHQELLPLACAALGNMQAAADFAERAQLLEPSELARLLSAKGLKSMVVQPPTPDSETPEAGTTASKTVPKADDIKHLWPRESAIIVDLALCTEPQHGSGLTLLRLPHCVYVPIGIGYSVLAWPLLARNAEARKWTARLLSFSAQLLVRSKADLSKIGIELDQRLWQHLGEV